MADVARAEVVPGACDNLSSVAALVAIAEACAHGLPPGRLVLLSTGSEESFLEGMAAFLRRHEAELPRGRTEFICLESVGSDGEGMLKLHRYPDGPREALAGSAHRYDIQVEPYFRFRFATDGQLPLLAGYDVAVIASVDWYGAPRNYHWRTDATIPVVRGFSRTRGGAIACRRKEWPWPAGRKRPGAEGAGRRAGSAPRNEPR